MKLTHTILISAGIIAVGLLGSQYMKQNSIEKQQVLKFEQEQKAIMFDLREAKEQEQKRQGKINSCLDEAYTLYSTDWDNECQALNLGDDCRLFNSDKFDDKRAMDEKNCYTRY